MYFSEWGRVLWGRNGGHTKMSIVITLRKKMYNRAK